MGKFSLSLSFPPVAGFEIRDNECWFVSSDDGFLTGSFFSWLEGRKYFPGASLSLSSDELLSSDIYVARHHYHCLRFSATESESLHFYYQQRYHATENEGVESLRHFLDLPGEGYLEEFALSLGLGMLMDEKINMLSTGEFRKACLLKEAMAAPFVIFLDEPFTGLDAESCRQVEMLFGHMVRNGTSVVIFSASRRRPGLVNRVLKFGTVQESSSSIDLQDISIPLPGYGETFETAFELKNITARYSGRDVLHEVSWSVKCNEKWSLTGHNGAGKSTLLSFVYADNPQVYGNDVWLFGRKRGSGESIWELKDRIGFYSSELHRYFNRLQSADSAIDSIIFQNPYERRVLTGEEELFREQLLAYFGLEQLRQKMLCDLPLVTQKLVLLAAVLLKNAPLVILDEPFQGFGRELIDRTLALLERYIVRRTFIMVSHDYSEFPPAISRHFHLVSGKGFELPGLT